MAQEALLEGSASCFGMSRRPFFRDAAEVFLLSGCLGGHFSGTPPRFSRFWDASEAISQGRHRGFRAFGVSRRRFFRDATEVFALSGRLGGHFPGTPPRFSRFRGRPRRGNLGGVCGRWSPRRPENAKTSMACVKDGRRHTPKARKPRWRV